MRKFLIRALYNIAAYGIGICASIPLILFTRTMLEKTQNVAGNMVIVRVITVLIYTVTLMALYYAFHTIVRRLFSKKEKSNDRDEIVADWTAGMIAGALFPTLVFGENGFQSFAITPIVVACQAVMLVSGVVVNKYYKYFGSFFAIFATVIVCFVAEIAGISQVLINSAFSGYILAILRNAAASDNRRAT